MSSAIKVFIALCMPLVFGSCGWFVHKDVVFTSEVQVDNQSSKSIHVSTSYRSGYSSSACLPVDKFDDVVEPGTSLIKTIKMDCSDGWTVQFVIDFNEYGVEGGFRDSISFMKPEAHCETGEETSIDEGLLKFVCVDDGCFLKCVDSFPK